MKPSKELIAKQCKPLDNPNSYASPNSAVDEIKEKYFIKGFEAAQQQGWVSVETPPEVGKEVLVVYKYEDTPIQAYFNRKGLWIGSKDLRDWMAEVFTGDPTLLNQDMITHWMPLPSPPDTNL